MEYNHDYYETTLATLLQMYEGYEDYYWDLVYTLEPYELILFYEQVSNILTNSPPLKPLSPGGDTSL